MISKSEMEVFVTQVSSYSNNNLSARSGISLLGERCEMSAWWPANGRRIESSPSLKLFNEDIFR